MTMTDIYRKMKNNMEFNRWKMFDNYDNDNITFLNDSDNVWINDIDSLTIEKSELDYITVLDESGNTRDNVELDYIFDTLGIK